MSSPAAAPLPVGFRFRPTDEELVRHYLKPKIAGIPHPDLLLIPDVDLSACEPWDLPAKALIKSDDPEWFFFAPLDRKYPGGHRSNRSTASGYWKATGKDRLIRSRPGGTLIGVKKTLVFHRGRAPRGSRTAWIMHEYRTTEPQHQGSFVLYRLFDKHEEEANSDDSPSTSSPANFPVVKSENPAHLLKPPVDPTAPEGNVPLLDILAHLPDLQTDQTFDGFPTITSPMRPYTDHPFLGNAGEQHLSAYFNSIIAHQDLEETLSCTTGNPDPTLMPRSSSNDNQSQLHSNSAEMEPPNTAAQSSPGSWNPYFHQLFNQPSGSDMTNSDAFGELEGWAAEPMMQQEFTVSNLPDPQQGTASRRIRLVHSVQRATVTEPVLSSPLESEDEAGSSYSTGNSSTTHEKDYANLISQTTAGKATHVQDGGLLPTEVDSSVEVTEKPQGTSFGEHILSNAKLPHEANLKQRLKHENLRTRENVCYDSLQDSGRVAREPSNRRQQHAPMSSVVRLLCLALVMTLTLVCLWKSSLCKSLH